jgi:hypothetical protein
MSFIQLFNDFLYNFHNLGKFDNLNFSYKDLWGTRWRSWLRRCATSRKVAGSIPDVIIGVFNCHNPSGRTMALGLTQPLTEMSTRNNSCGGKGGSYTNLPKYLGTTSKF